MSRFWKCATCAPWWPCATAAAWCGPRSCSTSRSRRCRTRSSCWKTATASRCLSANRCRRSSPPWVNACWRWGRADVAIVSEVDADEAGVDYHALFGFEIRALLANTHPLVVKPHLVAQDFADQTIITYPVPDEMLDLIRQVLEPAGVRPPRRTTELTVAMLQLVASGRGVAALPLWAVQSYLDRGYVTARPIGEK